mmetsp:Transcript_148046/g.369051  ORF Transcript_148046/g.369051 Transcript_148046/m.369051 type:complete len:276 (-) Transcript_148046:74-901(-)
MAAQDAQEREVLTETATSKEEIAKNADESDLGEARLPAHQKRWGRLPALVGIALAAALVLLAGFAVARRQQGNDDAATEAVQEGEAEALYAPEPVIGTGRAKLGPFGEYAGPAPPFDSGKYFFGRPSSNMGSYPLPPEPHSLHKPPGCKGIGCNGGKLCCGKDAKCCGTSCCSGGSICCNSHLGLCCAAGTMCCYGKFCCSPSLKCGDTRVKDGSFRFQILQQCGGGAQIRRLVEQVRYKREFRKLLSTNETGLKELLGIPSGDDEATVDGEKEN